MRLDLELEADPFRHQVDQLLEQERVLRGRLSRGVTDERRSDLFSGPLARPAIKRGAEREQRIVQQDQPIVGGQAYIGLEALDRAGQGMAKGGPSETVKGLENRCFARVNEPPPAPWDRDQSSGPERSAPSTRGWLSITGASMSSKPSKPAWRAIASKPAGVKPQYTKSSWA